MNMSRPPTSTRRIIHSWFFVYLIIIHSLSSSNFLAFASFQSGQSSSIGVLPTTLFSNLNALNIPLSGTVQVKANCGWTYAATGNTSPGYFTVARFGIYNLGADNVGESNVGFGNVGYGNYGTYNIGRLNTGTSNIGYLNGGTQNIGALNSGTQNIGDGNTQPSSNTQILPNLGYNNVQSTASIGTTISDSSYAIGSDLTGQFLIGTESTGYGQIGTNNTGYLNVGISNINADPNSLTGNIGLLNVGEGSVGANNIGELLIGQNNVGNGTIGLYNYGTYQIGFNNTVSDISATISLDYNSLDVLNIGYNQTGAQAIGADNLGFNLTGFLLDGSNLIGTVITGDDMIALNGASDIPYVPIPPISFSTVGAQVENVGTTYNSIPTVEQASAPASETYTVSVETQWQVNLDQPALLSVVDLGCPDEIINVLDWNSLILTTSFMPGIQNPSTNCADPLSEADNAMAHYGYSRGFITLQPGLHILTFQLDPSTSGNSGTALAFRLDSIRPTNINRCPGPVPFLNPLNPKPLIERPPPFALPKYISEALPKEKLAALDGNERNIVSSNNMSVQSEDFSEFSIDDSVSLTLNETIITSSTDSSAVCESKNYFMLRDLYVGNAEARNICFRMRKTQLARPSTPAGQLEITSLLGRCQPSNPDSLTASTAARSQKQKRISTSSNPMFVWIGSDWNGQTEGGGFSCLVAKGEKVVETKNCREKYRFICAAN